MKTSEQRNPPSLTVFCTFTRTMWFYEQSNKGGIKKMIASIANTTLPKIYGSG